MNVKDFLACGCFIAVPNLNKVWILTNFSSYEKNEATQFAFYKNDFFLTETNPWLRAENHFEIEIEDFKNILRKFESTKPIITWEPLNQKNYRQQFDSLIDEIKIGSLVKGVPFAHQTAEIELNEKNILYLLSSLLNYENKSNLYLYGFWNSKQKQGFMGASPELLFTQNDKSIETYALAGTICNHKILETIDNKIVREHNLVIDGIKKDLAHLGKINVEKTVLLQLEKFSHLKSVLQLKLKDKFDYTQILAAIHPTPALGAFPKREGFNWLRSMEKKLEKRFDYCSPFGICVDEYFSLCVGVIRCLQWQNNSLRITAGGGVIEESVFEDEWQEICMKIDSVKNYFNMKE